MRSFGFLLSRRWALFALVVAALAVLAWRLGEWQFDRQAEREARNAVVEQNSGAEPVPVDRLLSTGTPVAFDEQWRRVTARGVYDVDGTVVIRYRTRDGQPGVDVVVPLRTDAGPALVVDRGWYATDERTPSVDDVPAPPAGEVEVTGWVQADSTLDAATVTDGSARSVSAVEIGRSLGVEVYGGHVELASESPAAAQPLTPVEPPDLGAGPHFFYGLQWWFFGVLAVVGFGYLLYDEWRGPRGPRPVGREGRDRRFSGDPTASPAVQRPVGGRTG